jgi:hypothetical protein
LEIRYWGDKASNLTNIKSKYDPHHIFWCRNCIGDEENISDFPKLFPEK